MTDASDAIAELGPGAPTAHAVEPSAGEGDDGHTHESACLNCGTPLVGPHCHGCGQAAHVHRTLGAFFHDLLHGVLHFEGKIAHTLPLLAWRPGKLTREYIDGRRARHISPIALFLFSVFLTFAAFSLFGDDVRFDTRFTDPQSLERLDAAGQRLDADIARLARERAAAIAAGRPVAAVDDRLAAARRERALLGQLAAGEAPETIATGGGPRTRRLVDAINAAWRKAQANPALLVYKLQSNAYKYSWLLIPISAAFLWLLFPFSRRFGVYDHTVFVTYSLSFVTLLVMVASLGSYWGIGALTAAPLLYVPVHLYRQLRETYDLSRRAALWRTAAVLVFAGWAIILFAAALLAMAVNA